MAPLLPGDMERIRKVFDAESAARKHSSIETPRDDALMFRSASQKSLPCECIVELYEVLWRWGHNCENRCFVSNFGFKVPDTVVIEKGRPYAWYFISVQDGALLRKSAEKLTLPLIQKKLAPESVDPRPPVAAVWYPKASQFPEAQCHSPHAEFLSLTGCQSFLTSLRGTHSGILQVFVQPHGMSNFSVRTVQFRGRTSLCTRTNRAALVARGCLFDRAATFEGWEGLSSSSSRYRSHKHPQMEALLLAAGEMVNRRIEQERVRQMLFLPDDRHVALHFKVDADNRLFFTYASVVSEREVILQTRSELLMGDDCMTDALPGAALLPGGTLRKAAWHMLPGDAADEAVAESGDASARPPLVPSHSRGMSLPPLRRRPSTARQEKPQLTAGAPAPQSARGHSASSARREVALLLPKMPKPEVPPMPFRVKLGANEEQRREIEHLDFEQLDDLSGLDSVLKKPLVERNSGPPTPPRRPPQRPSRPRGSPRGRPRCAAAVAPPSQQEPRGWEEDERPCSDASSLPRPEVTQWPANFPPPEERESGPGRPVPGTAAHGAERCAAPEGRAEGDEGPGVGAGCWDLREVHCTDPLC